MKASSGAYRFLVGAQPYVALFLAVVVLFIIILSSPISAAAIPDFYAFHEGEQFQNIETIRRYWAGDVPFPLFVHGAMDYIPSMLGQALAGENRIIYGGRLALLAVSTLTWAVFVYQLIYIFRWKALDRKYLAVVLGLLALSFSTQDIGMVFVMEGTLGRRDLFIVLQSLSLLIFCTAESKSVQRAALVSLFALIPFSLGWSYDRGVAATVGCAAVGGLLLLRRDFANAALAVGSMVASALFMWVTAMFGRPHEIIANILYWARYSGDIWSTNPTLGPGLLFSMLPLGFIVIAFACAFLDKDVRTGRLLYYVAFLAVVEVLLLKSAFNRPLLHRTLAVSWPALCAALIVWPSVKQSETMVRVRSASEELLRVAMGVLIFSIVMLFVEWTITPTLRTWAAQAPRSYPQLQERLANLPTDQQLAGPETLAVARHMKDENCLLNWANQGMVAVLLPLPHCTRFPYLIYVHPDQQEELIRQIRLTPPKHVIIDSRDFAVAIDDRPMKERLPRVYEFLVRNYPQVSQIGRYTVLSRPAAGAGET